MESGAANKNESSKGCQKTNPLLKQLLEKKKIKEIKKFKGNNVSDMNRKFYTQIKKRG